MLERERLESKKISKTESVQSQMGDDPLEPENIHIGPSDWVAWQKDNKIAFIRGPESHPYAQERFYAYCDVLQEPGSRSSQT
jgi:myo-inositol-1-phosphate synthase